MEETQSQYVIIILPFDNHHYSVPFNWSVEQVDIRLTATTVEILF